MEWLSLTVKQFSDKMMVGKHAIMWQWESPLMEKYANILASQNGDLLEIGFGMGIFANCIQNYNIKSHTIIEPHPNIFSMAEKFKEKHIDKDIILINDFWQNAIDKLAQYDAIFFDSWSGEDELDNDVFTFFKIAANKLLKPNGKLAFWYYNSSLSVNYQIELLKYFEKFVIYKLDNLKPSPEARSLGFKNSTILPVAINYKERSSIYD